MTITQMEAMGWTRLKDIAEEETEGIAVKRLGVEDGIAVGVTVKGSG